MPQKSDVLILEQIKNAELKFAADKYNGNSPLPCLVQKFGDFPILLSAPHAVNQTRNGIRKPHEFYTGAIAECLAQQVKCSCITRLLLDQSANNDDPNTDGADCPYKKAVKRFLLANDIKLFVDIHGLAAKREGITDICINGGNNLNNTDCVYELQKRIENKFGAGTCFVDKYFSAAGDNVMSKWVHSAFGISAIQLEISGAYRWFEGDTEQQSLTLFLILKNWLENLSTY